MSTRVQFRRGNTAQTAAFTGAVAEVTINTDNNTLVVQDGVTTGGWQTPTLAFTQAAFNTANAAGTGAFVQSAFNQANSANVLAQSSYNFANSVNTYAFSAYSTANTAASNTVVIQGVDATQNTWIAANQVYSQAAYAQANTANTKAQSGYDFANTVNVYAYSAYSTANSAQSNTINIQGVDSTQNAWIAANQVYSQSAFAQANLANTKAQSGYDFANTVNVYVYSAYSTANLAQANTINIQGVDATQNAWIAANQVYSQAAFAFANTVNAYAYNANTYLQSAISTANSFLKSYSDATFFTKSGGTISGAVTIQSDLSVTGNITFTGNATSQVIKGNTGQFFGYSSNGFNALYAGIPTGYLIEPQMITQFTSNYNGYAGVNHQNINSGANSSSDIFITPDNGTANDGYVDIGMGSSTYNYPGYNIIKPNDGYFLVYGNTTTGGGNLIMMTGLTNDIVFAANGTTDTNVLMRISGYGNNVVITSTVNAVSNTTGALVISGGLGVAGNVYAGNLYSSGTNIVSYIGSAYNQANTANTKAQSGYDFANNINTYAYSAYSQANIANTKAQAGFDFANTVNTYAYSAYSTANSAQSNTIVIQGVDSTQNTWIAANQVYSQAAFSQANTANTKAQSGYDYANTVNVYTQSAYNQANTANTKAQSGYDYANTVNTYAYSAYSTANSAQANTVISQGVDATQNTWIAANQVYSQAAFAQANLANTKAQAGFDFANTVNTYSYSAYAYANSVNVYTQAAFNQANTANTKAQSGYDFANTVNTYSYSAYSTANSAQSNTVILQGVNTTQNTWIAANQVYSQASFAQANLANTRAQSGYDFANTVNAYAYSAYSTANSAQANTINIQGVDATQNTWIAANQVYSQAAFAFANTVNSYAYSAYAQANSEPIGTAAFVKANGAVQTGFTTIAANGTNISPSTNTDTLTITSAVANGINILNPSSKTIDFGLRNSGVTAGTYGNTTSIPTVTVDSFGRVTAISNNSITVPAGTSIYGNTGQITANAATGTVALGLATSGVSSGTYGGATQIPVLTVDTYGRVTSAANTSVSTTISLTGTTGSGSVSGGGTLTFLSSNGFVASVSGSTVTLSGAQDIRTTSSPSFANLTATSTTASISNTTGALVVTGGVGITGNTWIGGSIVTQSITTPTGSVANLIIDPDGVGDVIFPNSTELFVQSTAASNSNTTGAIVVSGGLGVAGNVYSNAIYTNGLFYAANGQPISTGGGGGATLSSVSGSTTYYLGLSTAASGSWTNAYVDTTNLFYTSSNNTLYVTNYNTSSDAKLKDNIITIPNPVDTINKLRGVSFTWKKTGEKSYGVIAQELQEILPELVSDAGGHKSVNYNALIGFLIETVKELSDRVTELEKK
jgi:hypothetical protein